MQSLSVFSVHVADSQNTPESSNNFELSRFFESLHSVTSLTFSNNVSIENFQDVSKRCHYF